MKSQTVRRINTYHNKRSLGRQTTTWRISTAFGSLGWLESDLMRPPFSAALVFSQFSGCPLCWWPNSKLILSSPIWQRGRTSGIHSITNGPASFWSAEPEPAETCVVWLFKYKCSDWLLGDWKIKSYSPTLRKVRSSIGRMACGRSVLNPSGNSGLGGGSGQWKRE